MIYNDLIKLLSIDGINSKKEIKMWLEKASNGELVELADSIYKEAKERNINDEN